MKLLHKLEHSKEFWFLLISCAVFFLLRFPSLYEPYWYGDEGIYQTIGLAMRHGRLLYSGIWDNKPPLLYIIYSLSSGDQFAAKLLSLIFGLGAIIVFYFIAKKLLVKPLGVWLSTSIFTILFGLPLLEGNIANAENFMLLPILSGAYVILHYKINNKKAYFIAGFMLGLAFLLKIVAVF